MYSKLKQSLKMDTKSFKIVQTKLDHDGNLKAHQRVISYCKLLQGSVPITIKYTSLDLNHAVDDILYYHFQVDFNWN